MAETASGDQVLTARAHGEAEVKADLTQALKTLTQQGVPSQQTLDFTIVSVDDQDHDIGSLLALQRLVEQLK